jgi:hypothetical protein
MKSESGLTMGVNRILNNSDGVFGYQQSVSRGQECRLYPDQLTDGSVLCLTPPLSQRLKELVADSQPQHNDAPCRSTIFWREAG